MDEVIRADTAVCENSGRSLSILLSAYACEPDQGSEPGVGWRWAVNLADLGHVVWVITRTNNRDSIERELSERPRHNLNILYYDLPPWARQWKKGPRGVRLYYILWQIGAYRLTKRLRNETNIDVVHHITFGVFRHPSFMALLGLPFVFGPLGGGERAPFYLRRGLPVRGQLVEALRDIANFAVNIDPIMHYVYRQTSILLCKTQDTMDRIPAAYRQKCLLQLEIGIDEKQMHDGKPNTIGASDELKVLYVGRLLYWKGIHLALHAFSRVLKFCPKARFTIIGKGRDEVWLRNLSNKLDIEENVHWVSWMPRESLMEVYHDHDVLLFPSLHDSSGNVVLEAMAASLPVVCLDLGGPGAMVDETCGIPVSPARPDQVIEDIGSALVELSADINYRNRLSHGARKRARENFSWKRQAERIDKIYRDILAERT